MIGVILDDSISSDVYSFGAVMLFSTITYVV